MKARRKSDKVIISVMLKFTFFAIFLAVLKSPVISKEVTLKSSLFHRTEAGIHSPSSIERLEIALRAEFHLTQPGS